MILISFKIVVVFNTTSADFVLMSADFVLKTTTILKEMRISQLSSYNERTLPSILIWPFSKISKESLWKIWKSLNKLALFLNVSNKGSDALTILCLLQGLKSELKRILIIKLLNNLANLFWLGIWTLADKISSFELAPQ